MNNDKRISLLKKLDYDMGILVTEILTTNDFSLIQKLNEQYYMTQYLLSRKDVFVFKYVDIEQVRELLLNAGLLVEFEIPKKPVDR